MDGTCSLFYIFLLAPIISVVKLPIYGIINAILLLGCFVASTVVGAPQHLYYAFKVALRSPRYGPIAKTIGFLSIIPTVALSVAVWAVIIVLGWVITTIGLPFFVTYGAQPSDFYRMDNIVWTHIADVFQMYTKTMVLHIRTQELPNPDGSVFELKVYRIFTGIVIGAFGIIVDTVVIGLCVVIKFVPVLFYTVFRVIKAWTNSGCAACCFVPFLVALAATFAVVPIGAVLMCVGGALVGASTTLTTFAHGERAGFYRIFTYIYYANLAMNTILGIDQTAFSCWDYSTNIRAEEHPPSLLHLPPSYQTRYVPPTATAPPPPPTPQSLPITVVVVPAPVASAPPAVRLTINHIWTNFFNMMAQVAIELLNTGVANRDDITSYEPYVLIGLPAVVVLKALLRTPHNAQHFTLADGTHIDQMTRPVDVFSTQVYNKMVTIKRDLADLTPNTDDVNFLMKFLYTSDHTMCNTERARISDDRVRSLMKIASKITDIAIMITIVPTFQSNFAGVVRTI